MIQWSEMSLVRASIFLNDRPDGNTAQCVVSGRGGSRKVMEGVKRQPSAKPHWICLGKEAGTSIARSASRSIVRLVLMALALAAPGVTYAQSYPAKTVHFITGLSVGLDTDTTMRIIAQKLDQMWGQSAVIFNRPGAGANIAADLVAKAAPDGYTLLIATDSLTISPAYFKTLSYDPVKDLVPVTQVTALPSIVCVNSSLPVHSVKDLIALAKAEPNKLTYGSVGVGSLGHLAAALFTQMAGIKMRHIPYGGGPQVYKALVSGEVALDFGGLNLAVPLEKAGKIRCIAVTTPTRSPAAPDVPTLAESGVPGYGITLWGGIFAPAGTPQAIIDKVSNDIATVLKMPDVRERLKQLGETPVGSTPAEFDTFFKEEMAMWANTIKVTGIRAY